MTAKQNDFSSEAFEAAGVALADIGRAIEGYRDLEVRITGMTIRGPHERGGEYLATVRGVDGEGERWVGFHNAFSILELMRGVNARLSNGSMKWREDQFAR